MIGVKKNFVQNPHFGILGNGISEKGYQQVIIMIYSHKSSVEIDIDMQIITEITLCTHHDKFVKRKLQEMTKRLHDTANTVKTSSCFRQYLR